jgi:LPS-assembly protein
VPRGAFYLGALLAAAALPAAAAGPSSPSHGGSQAPALFSADEVQYDEDLGLVVAKGNVEISQGDQILLADTVTYNQRTDTVTASGHVSLLQPSGDIVFADFVELTNNMRDGFIRDLRMLMVDRSRLAGNTARRVNGNRVEIRRGVYTSCEPCAKDPNAPPLWQIKGEEIISDKELEIVEYRDAVMEIDGWPVFYTPYFSHPDPSVKRRSGFLAPSFGNSPSNGLHVKIPYYWDIDADKDATFEPIFSSLGGQTLGGEYRERFSNGELVTNGAITFGSQSSSLIDTTPVSGPRGYLFAHGALDLTEDWRTGLDVQRASDQTYLLRYQISSPPDFLATHLYGERFGSNSYFNLSSWGFQSLQPGVGNSIEPIIAPVADYQWQSDPGVLGGHIDVEGNALDLIRHTGIDTRRLSSGAGWTAPVIGPIGERYTFYFHVRGDGYDSDNLPVEGSTLETQTAFAGRAFPQAAITMEYPWIRRANGFSERIEPVVMVAGSPYGSNPGTIPNEDSQGLEYDETSLFLPNRFPGFDRVDSGQRVDYGIRTGVYGDGGGFTRFIVGQSYSMQVNNNFLPGSGLERHLSDVVGAVTISPAAYLDLIYRFRVDGQDLALRRQEVTAQAGPSALRLSTSYIQIAAVPNVPQLPKQKELVGSLSARLTRYWSMQLQGVLDLSPSQPVTAVGTPINTIGTTETLLSGVGVTYRNECLALVATVSQSGIVNGDVKPGTSFLFTIVFKNLGDVAL